MYNKNIECNRQVFLDTETTGMNLNGDPSKQHKIIEIGAVETINRKLTNNNFHIYLQPHRLVDPKAFEIHGISDEFLIEKPVFSEIFEDFINFIQGSQLVIHNAPFDVSFINSEFDQVNKKNFKVTDVCSVYDTLVLARKLFPGKRNSLDALCKRYNIRNKNRILHGALLDAQILANVYLAMTSGQKSISFSIQENSYHTGNELNIRPRNIFPVNLRVIKASKKETREHDLYLKMLEKFSSKCIWYNFNTNKRGSS